jgi:hypothetical protein
MSYYRQFADRILAAEGDKMNRLDEYGRPIPGGDGSPKDDRRYSEPETVLASPLGRISPADRLTARVDWDFILDLEGNEISGYVPRNADNRIDATSGVTIAGGFDLGQHDEDDLQSLGLPQPWIDSFRPYLGIKGQAAEDFLKKNPLKITDEQKDFINPLLWKKTYEDVSRRYNIPATVPFEALPREAQTVIMSVAHQYGSNLALRTPEFWTQVTRGRWQDAHDNLMDFKDSYGDRRRREAALLKRVLGSGRLPLPRDAFPEPTLHLAFDPAGVNLED